MNQEPSPASLTFHDHCDKSILVSLSAIKVHSESAFRNSLFDSIGDEKGCASFSRWLFWNIFAGVVDPDIEPERNLEKIILLKKDYEKKKASHLKTLAETEASDIDNPLSTQFRACFELDTKNQINIDLVRMSIKPEQTKRQHTTLFNILYIWGIENSTISYRQGRLIRHERNCGVPSAGVYRRRRPKLHRPPFKTSARRVRNGGERVHNVRPAT